MTRPVLTMLFAFAILPAWMPAAAMDTTTESCFYDKASDTFGPGSAGNRRRIARAAGTISGSEHLQAVQAITVDGLRYEKTGESREMLQVLNEAAAYGGMVKDVHFFRPQGDQYSKYIFLPNDPRNCSWVSFQYRPEMHFAWMEEQSEFTDGFLFKHPALAVDPASFRKQGEYVRGIGFSIFGHPHKQDDGSQPRYNRTYIEADCAGKRLRILDARSYAAGWELTSIIGGSEQWFTADDVYPALAMQMHVMCEVPHDTWGEDTRLPGTLDEFSDYIHALAHGKVE